MEATDQTKYLGESAFHPHPPPAFEVNVWGLMELSTQVLGAMELVVTDKDFVSLYVGRRPNLKKI